MRSGLQRYRCKEHHKTFNILTLTPLARLQHKEQWAKYAQDLKEGKSIRASAKYCHIHPSISFRWRHRMLQIPLKTKTDHLTGIVEFDETYFLESFKGNRHIDRGPRKRGATQQAKEDSRQNRLHYSLSETEAVMQLMLFWRKAIKIQLLK